MKKYNEVKTFSLLLFMFLFVQTGCSKDSEPDPVEPPKEEPKTNAQKLQEADWETHQVSEEITWKYFHFDDLFSSTQSITVFEVDMNDEDVSLALPSVTSGFLKTSDAGWQSGALAAINGSYFDTSKGGSTTFFKKDGKIVNLTRSGFNPYREDAGFSIDTEGDPSVVEKPSGGWASLSTIPNLLVSGPLLVMDGELVDQAKNSFTENRHPRTAIGVTNDNVLIAVVVDGRASQAHGMSTFEMAEVMSALGCTQAMNLDGGGSSTAWIKTKGVVNYPSDNKKFDHEGERGVATVISFVVEE